VTASAPHLVMGRAAEDAACLALERAGYRLLWRNYRTRRGELDVVAMDRGVLALIEVRFRARREFGSAAESITARKRGRLVRAARELLARQPELARLPARFDVVEVEGPADELQCCLTRAAFSLGDG
jgi:putative endonuclease